MLIMLSWIAQMRDCIRVEAAVRSLLEKVKFHLKCLCQQRTAGGYAFQTNTPPVFLSLLTKTVSGFVPHPPQAALLVTVERCSCFPPGACALLRGRKRKTSSRGATGWVRTSIAAKELPGLQVALWGIAWKWFQKLKCTDVCNPFSWMFNPTGPHRRGKSKMNSDLLKELRNQRSSWALSNVLLISFSTTSFIRIAVLKALTINRTGRCVPSQCRTEAQHWRFCEIFLQTVGLLTLPVLWNGCSKALCNICSLNAVLIAGRFPPRPRDTDSSLQSWLDLQSLTKNSCPKSFKIFFVCFWFFFFCVCVCVCVFFFLPSLQ